MAIVPINRTPKHLQFTEAAASPINMLTVSKRQIDSIFTSFNRRKIEKLKFELSYKMELIN